MKKALVEILSRQQAFKEIQAYINHQKLPVAIHGLIPEALGHFCGAFSQWKNQRGVIVLSHEWEARAVYNQLQGLGSNVVYFPGKAFELYELDSMDQRDRGQRMEALSTYLGDEPVVMVTTWRAFTMPLTPLKSFQASRVELVQGLELSVEDLVLKLVDLGYTREDQVEGYGQFSRRGGIVDFFPPGEAYPVRLEFFGDEVDTIRHFDQYSQRSVEMLDRVWVYPSREWLIFEDELEEVRRRIKGSLKKHPLDRLASLEEQLAERIIPENRELLLPFAGEGTHVSLWAYLRPEDLVFLADYGVMGQHIEEEGRLLDQSITAMLEEGQISRDYSYLSDLYRRSLDQARGFQVFVLSSLLPNNPVIEAHAMFQVLTKPAIHYRGRWSLFMEELQSGLRKGQRVVFLTDQEARIPQLLAKLGEAHIPVYDGEASEEAVAAGQVVVLLGALVEGFSYVTEKTLILSERQVLTKVRKGAGKKKKSQGLGSLSELSPGDYVVHETHGIGVYQGTREMEIANVLKDYIHIQYAGTDQLYLPVDQLGNLHKYVGKAGKVKINKLHSPDWQKTKYKAKKAVEVMAEDLIQLYHKRAQAQGYAFSEDSPWQREFEDQFPYEETQGQWEVIAEVKEDMEKQQPMDRLLCADVGYGKTEVALRAAFKAIMDQKQVAFLVPTTILAQQHYATAVERFQNFPMKVEVLNRFKTPKEQKEILKDLKKGFIDMIIGTHRILSKDVIFKDLGLVIVDEEQRFGVKHKESLKEMAIHVDTLTLSATPIPRTLQMAMSGIRDMSTIEEPPGERFPVNTQVLPFQPLLLREAILKEMARGGQTYVVYNRVATMDQMAESLRRLVPEANVAYAHGQMSERMLEQVMMEFYQGEYDVLLCTTIIEIGMDVQNANTMFVVDAHKLGLSQLYQLRGRVGRWNRLAYCYFTYPGGRELNTEAQKRLMAMKQFTSFGSGFQIAMKDLEIRGAGNVLGLAQHGHMNAIGYDLYLKFLETSVRELKGESLPKEVETVVDIKVNGFIPKSYMPDEQNRLYTYQRIAQLSGEEDRLDLTDELIDRFGDIPKPLNNLMDIAMIRRQAMAIGVNHILEQKGQLKIIWDQEYDMDLKLMNRFISAFGRDLVWHMTDYMGMTLNIKLDALTTLKEWAEVSKCLKNH